MRRRCRRRWRKARFVRLQDTFVCCGNLKKSAAVPVWIAIQSGVAAVRSQPGELRHLIGLSAGEFPHSNSTSFRSVKLTQSLFLFFLSSLSVARACDLCAIYNVMDAQSGSAGGWSVSVAEQFTHFHTLQLDGREVENTVGQRLDSSITQLVLGHNFNSRFGLQFNVPFIYRDFRRPEEGGVHNDSTAGIGDVALVANFLAYRFEKEKTTFSWTLTGGVKFPTGSTHRLKEETLEGHEDAPSAEAARHRVHGGHEAGADSEEIESGVHGHDLTLGTGSYDGLIGTSIFARYERMFFTASVQYSLRSTGDYDYRFANDLTWSGGPGFFAILHDKGTLSVQLNCSGEHKDVDRFRGADSEDTGIDAVYLGPEIRGTWGDRYSAELGADFPVSIDNTALQLVPDFRLRASVTIRF